MGNAVIPAQGLASGIKRATGLSTPAETAGSIEQRAATVRAGAKDIGATAFSYAEKNVQASLDYAQALLHA